MISILKIASDLPKSGVSKVVEFLIKHWIGDLRTDFFHLVAAGVEKTI
jgi:hypothetical protein